MDEMMNKKFKDMIIEKHNTPVGMEVIMSMVGMLENDPRFLNLAELYEGIEVYGNFMTEREARDVVDRFIGYDGSRGGKWTSIDGISDELRKFGGVLEEKSHYNRWMMYVMLNNIHSDYGGVLSKLVQPQDYVKACYMMALAKIDDRDMHHSLREYFGLK
jgi:hypothetical protein